MKQIFSCVFFLMISLVTAPACTCNNKLLIKSVPEVIAPVEYFAPGEVKLSEGPLFELQEEGKDYLLWLNPDSLLHFFRVEAGLPAKAEPYAGWESKDVWGVGPLRGGFMGYYISSLAMMYKTTGDKRLLKQLKYTLSELEACQNAGKDGYILGVKDGRQLFKDVAKGKIETNNPTVNGAWAPLYLINKIMHGLTAAYTLCEEKSALRILTRFADWFGYEVLDKLTDEQIQKLLVCEHGSINESFVDVFALTGEKRYLEWGRRLNDRAMWEPLSRGENILHGWHANTQIPKFTGFEKYYTYSGDKRFEQAALNFWDIVTKQHTWVIGGNSTGEHFFPTSEFEKRVLLIGGPETCNSVNMMRLTEALFAYYPDAQKADYYERVLFNHILSAYDPEKGMCCYFTPMRPAHYRIYGSPDSSFWCCNQSGLETPAKLGKFIYSKKGKNLMVNLFASSSVSWKEQGLRLEQLTNLPESGNVKLILHAEKNKNFSLLIRNPHWSSKTKIMVNNNPVKPVQDENGYWILNGKWEKENVIEIDFSLDIYTEKLPGSDKYIALLYGPYVLAGRMGKEFLPDSFWGKIDNTAHNEIPIPFRSILPFSEDFVTAKILKLKDRPLTFKVNVKGYEDVIIEPFYRIHFERYTIYWPLKESK